MSDDDALKAAIDDVNSVANELRDLRQKSQHYGDASRRLDTLSESLLKLSNSVVAMQKDFASIVRRAEQVETNITQGRSAVDGLVAGIPDIVNRIEATDSAKSIAEFTKLLSEVRELMLSQTSTTQGMQAVIEGFADFSAEFRSIKDSTSQQTQLLQLVNQVLMQNVAGPVNENSRTLGDIQGMAQNIAHAIDKSTSNQPTQLLQIVNQALMQNVSGPVSDNSRMLGDLKGLVEAMTVGANKGTEGMVTLSVKLMKEIDSLRGEVASLRGGMTSSNQLLKEQGDRIETISKKKGFIF